MPVMICLCHPSVHSCPRSPAPSPRRPYPSARCIPWWDIVLAGEILDLLLYPTVSFTSDLVARIITHAPTQFSVLPLLPSIMAAVALPGPTQAPPSQNEIPGALNTLSWEGDKMYVLLKPFQ